MKTTTAAPVTTIARLASMNGAPRMAPTPTSSAACPPVNTMAMIGTSVSGRAVPTAASTLPTAPFAELVAPPEPLDAVGEELGRERG